jgi:anti-sigma factor RsiW
MRWSCRQYKALLPGYIERELSPKQRERVSRHLSSCAECYVAYTEQRQIVRELAISLPRIGASHGEGQAPRLEKIRAGVMSEMRQPKPTVRLYQARYSLVALILIVTLLMPWTMRGQAFPLPTPPQPEQVNPPGTPVVALPTADAATLTATLQSNYAPQPGATDTP